MWYVCIAIPVAIAALGGLLYGGWKFGDFDPPASRIVCLFAALLVWFVFVAAPLVGLGEPLIQATTGLGEMYGAGELEGVIVDWSVSGIIWKTEELIVQPAVEGREALLLPVHLSAESPSQWTRNQGHKELIGKRVSIGYRSWWLQPYRQGDSRHQITWIHVLE